MPELDEDALVPSDAPPVSIIVAVAENGVIGRGNRLPWRLPADLAHFRALTLDKPIVMGRRTWESLPGLLPRRRHFVLTRDRDYRAAGCEVLGSLDDALKVLSTEAEVMVVGGASLYAQALPRANRLYLTLVHARPEGDTHFPPWDRALWREVDRTDRPADEKNPIDMTFVELQRAAGPR